MPSMREQIRRRPVLVFFGCTFLLTWGAWIPMMILNGENDLLRIAGTFGPSLAALFVTAQLRGREGLQAIGRQLLRWRTHPVWYGFSLLMPPVLVLAAIWLVVALGMPRPAFNDPRQMYLVIPAFLYVLFLSVLGEEIGWRGFALPILQERWGALKASLAIGALWGVWHLPLFFISGNFHQEIPLSLFLLQELFFSIVLSWLYNRTGRSLLQVHLFHAASNTALGVLPVLPMDTGGDLRALWIAVLFLGILAAAILLKEDPDTLGWVEEDGRMEVLQS